jgi:nucleoid-associated protein YgaU
LKAKAIKDITPADTTDYTMNGTFVVHELKRGETIIQLANMYYGDKRLWPYIVKYNRMEDFNNVAIGQMVNIPVLRNNR